MAKRLRAADDFIYHIYIHMNDVDQFVLFSGLKLQQFISSVDPVRNILLLNNGYEEAMFNQHTQHHYITPKDLQRFLKKAGNTDDICWVDFSHERQLNMLTSHEQAELLYMSHKGEPLQEAFFPKLQNRYTYLSSSNGKVTKVYFRHLSDTDMLIANLFNQTMKEREGPKGFFRRGVRTQVPSITPEFLKAYRTYAKDGALFSLAKADKNAYDIEIRSLAHYRFPDEIWDDLKRILQEAADDRIYIT